MLMVLTEVGNWPLPGEVADFLNKLADLIHKKHLWPDSNTFF